ncbi:14083_t:CDS:2, partial [Acaulospora morrowiae]
KANDDEALAAKDYKGKDDVNEPENKPEEVDGLVTQNLEREHHQRELRYRPEDRTSKENKRTENELQLTIGNSKGRRYEDLNAEVTVALADPSSTKYPPIPMNHRDQGGHDITRDDTEPGRTNGRRDELDNDEMNRREDHPTIGEMEPQTDERWRRKMKEADDIPDDAKTT